MVRTFLLVFAKFTPIILIGQLDGKANWWGATLLPVVLSPPHKYFWRIRIDIYNGLIQVGVSTKEAFDKYGSIRETKMHHYWIGK